MKSVSVTEVRNALRCPRLFALGRLRGQQVGFPVGESSLGATFHRIVDAFARSVDSPPPRVAALPVGAPRDDVAAALSGWLLGYLARELAANAALATMVAEVDDLADALRSFARFIADELPLGTGAAVAVAGLFKYGERPIEATVERTGAEAVRLTGRIDALYATARGELDLVEYKLTAEANQELDRAQVALYRFILRQHEGIDACPVVLRFNPELVITRIPGPEADALVERQLLPLVASMAGWAESPHGAPATQRADLCPACPVREACVTTYAERLSSRDDPPAGALRPRTGPDRQSAPHQIPSTAPVVSPPDEDARKQAENVKARIQAVLRSLGVSASFPRDAVAGARLIGLEISAGRGRVAALDGAAKEVIHRLRSEHDLELSYEKLNGLRRFWTVRRSPRAVPLGPLLDRERSWLSERPGRFILGETNDGSVLKGDLGDSTLCHLLVGGTTGSGKSVLLKVLIASLAQYHAPSHIQFTLIDPKRVTFGSFRKQLSSHLAQPLCHDADSALQVLEGLVDEMERRYALLALRELDDINEYNGAAAPGEQLPRHVVVIDEYQDLLTDKALRGPFEAAVQRLGAKARAAGIHLILATQRPDATTVTGVIKANLPGRIALRVQQKINSRIILGQTGAEELLGRGDMLADFGQGLIRGQAATL